MDRFDAGTEDPGTESERDRASAASVGPSGPAVAAVPSGPVTPEGAIPQGADPRGVAPQGVARQGAGPGLEDLASVLAAAGGAWEASGRGRLVSEVGGAVAAVTVAGREFTAGIGAVADADVLALMDLAGQLKAVVDSMLVASVREAGSRSQGVDRREWLCRRAGFSSVSEMGQQLLRASSASVGVLKKAAAATVGSVAVSGAPVPARFPLLQEALDAGQLSLDQVRPILDRLAPSVNRADPDLFRAAEADLVGRATGGRHGAPVPDPTAGPVIGTGAAPTGDGVDVDAAGVPGAGGGLRGVGRERPAGLEAQAGRWVAALDQDGPEPRYEAIKRRRGLFKSPAGSGAGARYTIYSTTESEALIDALLESMISPRTSANPDPEANRAPAAGDAPEADGGPGAHGAPEANPDPDANPDSHAANDPGVVVVGDGDTRTMAQRKHDALEALLSGAVAQAPIQRSARPHLLVVAREEELLASLGKAFGDPDPAVLDQVDPDIRQAMSALAAAARGQALTPEALTAIQALASTAVQENAPTAVGGRALGGSASSSPFVSTATAGAPGSAPAHVGDGAGLGSGLFADPRMSSGAWVPQTDQVMPFSALATMICDGVVQTALTRSGEVIAFSSLQKRYFTAAQRRALMILYPRCAVPGCTIPATLCDAHHIEHVEQGGDTTVPNGILLCQFHHNQLHQGHYRVLSARPDRPGRALIPASAAGRGPTRHATTDRTPGVNLARRSLSPGRDNTTSAPAAEASEWVKDAIAETATLIDRPTTGPDQKAGAGWGTGSSARAGRHDGAGWGAGSSARAGRHDGAGWGADQSAPTDSDGDAEQKEATSEVDDSGWTNTWGTPAADRGADESTPPTGGQRRRRPRPGASTYRTAPRPHEIRMLRGEPGHDGRRATPSSTMPGRNRVRSRKHGAGISLLRSDYIRLARPLDCPPLLTHRRE